MPKSIKRGKKVDGIDALADQALVAMKRRAKEIGIRGVAVVAWSEGKTVKSWTSKMLTVGGPICGPSDSNPAGANFLGIAFTKAAEMADTLVHSGSGVRPPKTGEYGWPGGLVKKVRGGHLFAAFSGGPSADDVKVSRDGLKVLAKAF
jgi:hypothetical protein